MNSIVIARQQEEIEWILDIPQEFEVFVYNKGGPITDSRILGRINHHIQRPNAGREAETYIFHMLNHLAHGNGFTVFAQDEAIRHSPDFVKLLSNWREWSDLQPLGWEWRSDQDVPPPLLLSSYEAQLNGGLRVRPEHFSLMTWNPVGFFDQGAHGTAIDYRSIHGNLPAGTNIAAHFLRLAQLHELADTAQNHQMGVFCYGAIFAVRNDLIRALPIENRQLLHEATKAALTYGYVLERLWLHLFGAEFTLPIAPITPAPAKRIYSMPAVQVQPSKPVEVTAPIASAPDPVSHGMTHAEKMSINTMFGTMHQHVIQRDYYIVSSAWRYYGADQSVLDFYELRAKAPHVWLEAKPDFWLIYICVLIESGKYEQAGKILHRYRGYHGDRLIENYLPLAPLAVQNGIASEGVRKASLARDCFVGNRASRLFEAALEGKSVAIVGNGPSEKGKRRGAEIDSHDVVIRFNNYKTTGFEADYGNKTDIWIRGSGADDVVDRVDVGGYKLVVWEADYDHFPIHFNHLDIMYRYFQADPRKCDYFDFNTHFSLREASGIPFPSTGLVAFWAVYNLIGKSIDTLSLYGFSALEEKPAVNHPHYFEVRDHAEATRRSEVHFPEREAAFMRHILQTLKGTSQRQGTGHRRHF